MKLVILTQYFVPEMGAPQNRLYELALELQQLGWTVEIVTAMPNYPTGKIFDAYTGKFSVSETVGSLKTHRYWLYPSRSSRAFPRIVSMLSFSATALFSVFKIRRLKADYLMVESPPLTLACSGWLLARASGAKMIMNVSDLWPLSARELGAMSDGFFYKLLCRLENFLYRRADICTGQSQQIIDYIQERKKERVWLLRNGVDVSRFPAPTSFTRTNTIVYAGLLGVAQGVFDICQNIDFAAIGLEFHIYGSGNELEKISEFVTRHPEKGIRYQGIIPRDQIPAVLSRYDATLVSLVKNIYGAVPSKIYEAMAAGLPVVFSGSGEGATIISENRIGWTSEPSVWPQLTEALVRLKNLPDAELELIRQRARDVAAEKFDRRRQVNHFHGALLHDHQR